MSDISLEFSEGLSSAGGTHQRCPDLSKDVAESKEMGEAVEGLEFMIWLDGLSRHFICISASGLGRWTLDAKRWNWSQFPNWMVTNCQFVTLCTRDNKLCNYNFPLAAVICCDQVWVPGSESWNFSSDRNSHCIQCPQHPSLPAGEEWIWWVGWLDGHLQRVVVVSGSRSMSQLVLLKCLSPSFLQTPSGTGRDSKVSSDLLFFRLSNPSPLSISVAETGQGSMFLD